MNQKRFLLLIDALGSGGAERQIGYLAEELQRAGHIVKLCIFYDTANFYRDNLINKGIDVETHTEGTGKLRRPFVIRKLVRNFRPDLVIAYKDGAAMASCVAKLLCRFNLAVSERNTTQIITRGERIKFFLYRFADHIVPNSYSQAEFISRYFPGLNTKVSVITNMIDSSKFYPPAEHHCNDIPQIIISARVGEQKNALRFLEAVSLIKKRGIRCHFNWFGNIESYPEYCAKVNKRAIELEVTDYITFKGTSNSIEDEYRKSDIFILPSLYEGFPNVLCEAMACGLPCIATSVCDSPRILTDSRWLVDPYDPESIANAIEDMLGLTSSQRHSIGSSNHSRILELCSSESFRESYTGLLK